MEARHANEPARLDRIGATTSNPGVGERQRERIIRAATVVFSRKGYDGARVEAIARKAGMPKGNVLYYFKSKKAPRLKKINANIPGSARKISEKYRISREKYLISREKYRENIGF